MLFLLSKLVIDLESKNNEVLTWIYKLEDKNNEVQLQSSSG